MDREQIEQEWKAIMKWEIEEGQKLTARLKAENRYQGGLDGNAEDFKYIQRERNRRVEELKRKAGI